MNRCANFGFIAAVCCAATAGWAQDKALPPDIVVQGRSVDAPSTTQSVRAISQAVDGSLARFEQPVCPGVVGLPPRLAAGVLARMRATIASVGAELAREGCASNVTVIVADSGTDLVAGLRVKSPKLFSSLSPGEIDRLLNAPGPARAWHRSEPKRADGAPVVRDQGGGAKTYMVQGARMSRLSAPIRMDMTQAFVVIETAAIGGMTVGQIADFAVMRGLAPTRDPARPTGVGDSILNLFDPDSATAALSEFDRAYLAALYSGSNGFTYAQKTRQIAGQIDRAEPAGDR